MRPALVQPGCGLPALSGAIVRYLPPGYVASPGWGSVTPSQVFFVAVASASWKSKPAGARGALTMTAAQAVSSTGLLSSEPSPGRPVPPSSMHPASSKREEARSMVARSATGVPAQVRARVSDLDGSRHQVMAAANRSVDGDVQRVRPVHRRECAVHDDERWTTGEYRDVDRNTRLGVDVADAAIRGTAGLHDVRGRAERRCGDRDVELLAGSRVDPIDGVEAVMHAAVAHRRDHDRAPH